MSSASVALTNIALVAFSSLLLADTPSGSCMYSRHLLIVASSLPKNRSSKAELMAAGAGWMSSWSITWGMLSMMR